MKSWKIHFVVTRPYDDRDERDFEQVSILSGETLEDELRNLRDEICVPGEYLIVNKIMET